MKSIVRAVSAVLAGVLVLGMAGCGSKDVAVTVNGQVVTKTSIDTQLKQLQTQYPQLFTGTDGTARKDDFKKRLVDYSVSQLLITQEAQKEGITVTDAEVDKAIADLRKNFPTEQAFTAALQQNGVTLDQLKQQRKESLLAQRLVEKLTAGLKIDEKAMLDYYNKNKSTAFTDKAATRASHILLNEKDKALAEKILAQVKAGGDFAALAKKYSTDPGSKDKGGDLGWPTTPYVPEFQKAVDTLKVGALSGLVHTQYGWHIIKVTAKRSERVKTFAEVKDQVKQILTQQAQSEAYQKLLDQLKKTAKIEYADGYAPAASTATSTTPAGK